MGSPIETPSFGAAEPKAKFDPFTGKPLGDPEPEPAEGSNFWAQQQAAAAASSASPSAPDNGAVNPFAPTGWQKRSREEMDIKLPSGQLCRIMKLEREDLFKMNLMGYLDTFTPMLMEESISSEERSKRVRERMSTDSSAVANMFMAIDEVVMAATVSPKVTNDPKLVDYGGPNDWRNPRFVATAYVNDITMDDRFAIFAAAFGRSMDDLKSLWEQTPGMAGVADKPSVQSASE